jgi:hypothetical protein
MVAAFIAGVVIAFAEPQPTFLWVRSAAATNGASGQAIARDRFDNVYVTGNFGGTAVFGGTVLTSSAGGLFMVKYDAQGHVIWAKLAASNASVVAIVVDNAGNTYITGTYGPAAATFGSIVLTNLSFSSINLFVAKYDSLGNPEWARPAGSPYGFVNGAAIAVDSRTNVYVTGYSSGQAQFGDVLGPSTGVFLVKYDSAGTALWAQAVARGVDGQGVTLLGTSGHGISIDASDNIYLCGAAETGGGLSNGRLFISKLDGSGNLLWLRSIDGNGRFSHGSSISVHPAGGVCITGTLPGGSGTVYFDAIALTNQALPAVFIARCDASGQVLWANASFTADSFGTGAFGRGIGLDSSGNAYITGYFNSSNLQFGASFIQNANHQPPSASDDVFIAEYDPAGNVVWAASAGGIDSDEAYALTVDHQANLYVAGAYSTTKGPARFGGILLTNQVTQDVFVAKIGVPPPEMMIRPSGKALLIWWSSAYPEFVLQANGNVSAPINWTNVLTAPVPLGGQLVVVDPADKPQKFFRLIKPQ